MVTKLIRCPYCGEEIELTDLYNGMEVQCKLCGAVMIYQNGKFLHLDTNEEYELEELEEEIEEEFEEDEFEEEVFEEEDYYFEEDEY